RPADLPRPGRGSLLRLRPRAVHAVAVGLARTARRPHTASAMTAARAANAPGPLVSTATPSPLGRTRKGSTMTATARVRSQPDAAHASTASGARAYHG